MNRPIVLASASPRRRELLQRIVADFEVLPSDSPETARAEDPAELVRLLAREKAELVEKLRPQAAVIGADTVVALDGRIFGKPADRADAERMLRLLSGREHRVLTGVCVLAPGLRREWVTESLVRFAELSEAFLEAYLDTGIYVGKAGGYGIQCEPSPVAGYRGDYENIVGLPLGYLEKVLEEASKRKETP